MPTILPKTLTSLIAENYFGSNPSAETIAASLNMNPRTLQRYLSTNKITLKYLLEQVKFAQAKTFLSQESLSVAEIAIELGYIEPANFTRAFKRWSGLTPKQFKGKQSNDL